MKFVQVVNNVVVGRFNGGVNVIWDDTHFCPADKLTPEEAMQFGVYELLETQPPVFDPITQGLAEVDPVPINGVWAQQWVVSELDPETVAENQAAKIIQDNLAIQEQLREVDIKSIRALREWVAAQPSASQFTKTHEMEAAVLRIKVK